MLTPRRSRLCEITLRAAWANAKPCRLQPVYSALLVGADDATIAVERRKSAATEVAYAQSRCGARLSAASTLIPLLEVRVDAG